MAVTDELSEPQLSPPFIGHAPGRSLAAVVAAVLGNALEFYDFTIYAFFAVMIGRTFFPSENPYSSLLLSVGTYGVGYLTRPLGGVLIGAYADTRGRKAALTLTIGLMALGTLLLAVTPSYASIGAAAPCLVLLARLIQGFSTGGEMGPATTFLLEAAPPGQRGLYGAWQSASQGMATLGAGLVGVTLSSLLSPAQLQEWGWRVAFLLGLLIAPVGAFIRSRMPETLEAAVATPGATSVLGQLLRFHLRPVLLGALTIMGAAVTVALLQYMASYAIQVLHMPPTIALSATMVVGVASIGAGLAGGALSDRFGRKVVMIAPRVLLIFAIYPAFLVITEYRTAAALLGMTAVIGCLHSMSSAVMLVQVPEAFPRALRSTGLSLSYTLAVTLFGGTAQFVTTWFIARFGDPLAPAWYLIAINLVTLAAMLFATARTPRGTLD